MMAKQLKRYSFFFSVIAAISIIFNNTLSTVLNFSRLLEQYPNVNLFLHKYFHLT